MKDLLKKFNQSEKINELVNHLTISSLSKSSLLYFVLYNPEKAPLSEQMLEFAEILENNLKIKNTIYLFKEEANLHYSGIDEKTRKFIKTIHKEREINRFLMDFQSLYSEPENGSSSTLDELRREGKSIISLFGHDLENKKLTNMYCFPNRIGSIIGFFPTGVLIGPDSFSRRTRAINLN
jgi:hypothetical protein